jgi:hypothetical protein
MIGRRLRRSARHCGVTGADDGVILRGRYDLGQGKGREQELERDRIRRKSGDQPAAELPPFEGRARQDTPPQRD